MSETRKIAAILVADEDRTLARVRGLRGDLIDPAIDSHQGCIVKRTADDDLIEFCVVDAEHHPVWLLNGSLWVLIGLQ
jgi:adenylate cyclase